MIGSSNGSRKEGYLSWSKLEIIGPFFLGLNPFYAITYKAQKTGSIY